MTTAIKKTFTGLLRENSYRHRLHEVFRDFCELAALSISNSMDRSQYDKREARYLKIVKHYEREEVQRFPQMLACVVEALESETSDFLGQTFMELELGQHWHGQYFTPYPVAKMMAMMTVGDAPDTLQRQEFVTVMEPAAGSGVMVIAAADVLREAGINFQRCMHVTAVDIDALAVHMTYIQLSLMHVPAIVLHGNALSGEQWGYWLTPAHVMGFWDGKLARRRAGHSNDDSDMAEPAIDPTVVDRTDAVEWAVQRRDEIVSARAGQLALF